MNAHIPSEQEQPPTGTSPTPRHTRADFWVDSCRELTQMRNRSAPVITLYQQHGCRFWAPSCEQVESILAALDAALPAWEQQHPELFYQALEMNFPELVRKVAMGA